MKSLKYAKKISDETGAFVQLIESYCTKINKEYLKQTLELLKDIAQGEGLDFNLLKQKYIKTSRSDIEETDTSTLDKDDVILSKIEYDGKIYYIDEQNDNIAYDTSSNIVGKYTNKKIIFKN
jgi:hypothetical protein